MESLGPTWWEEKESVPTSCPLISTPMLLHVHAPLPHHTHTHTNNTTEKQKEKCSFSDQLNGTLNCFKVRLRNA